MATVEVCGSYEVCTKALLNWKFKLDEPEKIGALRLLSLKELVSKR